MRKKYYLILLFILLILTTDIAEGEKSNKTKLKGNSHTKYLYLKNKFSSDRGKRSLYYDDEKPILTKPTSNNYLGYDTSINDDNLDIEFKQDNTKYKIPNEPFWGNRGKRASTLIETFFETNKPGLESKDNTYYSGECKYCYKESANARDLVLKDDRIPGIYGNAIMKEKERRQDEDPKFWGSRGRRDDLPFWRNRGRRIDTPLFTYPETNNEMDFVVNNQVKQEDEPFWGNRGRREENEPFWGTRGKRQDSDPFWGNRGRREEPIEISSNDFSEPILENRGNDLKQSIQSAINEMEQKLQRLTRLNKVNINKLQSQKYSYWSNRGRDSTLKYLLTGYPNNKPPTLMNKSLREQSPASTFNDDRIYAEEPHFIIVERSSRSSREEDPYFISRGKKMNSNFNMMKAIRDRRGAFEDIVKSVKNDPYYIARGKKTVNEIVVGNSTEAKDRLTKSKDLVCATIESMTFKNKGNKAKREVDDRDRRNILKKLAAQLQNDPYFVSRGKKSDIPNVNQEYLEAFFDEINTMCNQN